MSKFDETVTKIASSPWKAALFPALPGLLHKQAAAAFGGSKPMQYLFGQGGGQEIAKNVASEAARAGVLALGGYGAARLLGGLDDSSEKVKSRYSTLGKLEAEDKFRASQLKRLKPLQERTFEAIQTDPVLAKADPNLMRSSYETMRRFAPTLAADPNATRAFLQESALYGTGPSYATLKTLADAEGAVLKTTTMGG